MTVETFDFRKPGRLPDFVSSLLKGWQDRVARLVGENWQRQFGKPLEVHVKDQMLLNGSEVVKRYESNAFANSIYLTKDDNDAMLCLPRELAIDLVEGLLDNIVTPEPAEETEEEPEVVEPRELTTMEDALLKMLFAEFASATNGAQPEHMGVEAKSGAVQTWKQSVWDVDADNEMVVVQFEFITPFAGKTFELLIAASLVEELALKVATASHEDKEESEVNHLVMEMPVEVVVQLGSRQLEMGELANLKPGDILVLDQRINQPLTGYVEGVPKYAGWPGKTGNRRVFQVSKS